MNRRLFLTANVTFLCSSLFAASPILACETKTQVAVILSLTGPFSGSAHQISSGIQKALAGRMVDCGVNVRLLDTGGNTGAQFSVTEYAINELNSEIVISMLDPITTHYVANRWNNTTFFDLSAEQTLEEATVSDNVYHIPWNQETDITRPSIDPNVNALTREEQGEIAIQLADAMNQLGIRDTKSIRRFIESNPTILDKGQVRLDHSRNHILIERK